MSNTIAHSAVSATSGVGRAVTTRRHPSRHDVQIEKPGDLAAVGCMVESDGSNPACQAGPEQFCPDITLTCAEVIPAQR